MISEIHVYSVIAVSLLFGVSFSSVFEWELLPQLYASSLRLIGAQELGLNDFNHTSSDPDEEKDEVGIGGDNDNSNQASKVVANAKAEPKIVDTKNQKVILDGSGSKGDIKEYSWEYVSGWKDDVEIVDESDEKAYFYSPSVEEPTTLKFKLTVQGETPEPPYDGPSSPDSDVEFVNIKISPPMSDAEAIARIQPSSSIVSGEMISLDGSKSKGYGEINYKWSVIPSTVHHQRINIEDDQEEITSVRAPDFGEPTELIFRLEIIDETFDEDSDEVRVTILPRETELPIPVAIAQIDGNDNLGGEYEAGDQIVLDGSKSYDPADPESQDNLQYMWNQNKGSDVGMRESEARKMKPSFVIPADYNSNDLGFKLVVTNENEIRSEPAFISFDVDSDTDDDTGSSITKPTVQVLEPPQVGPLSTDSAEGPADQELPDQRYMIKSSETQPPDRKKPSEQYPIDFSLTNPLILLLFVAIAIILGVTISIKAKSHKSNHHIVISTRGGIEK